jgi:hypothetical protein
VDVPFRARIKYGIGDGTGSGEQLSQSPLGAWRRALPSRLRQHAALILVVVLSTALWAVIWGAFVGAAFALGSLPGL